MGIPSIYNGISNWYGRQRLQKAMTGGILKKTTEIPEVAMEVIFTSLSGKKTAPRANYEHPFLGKNIDMFV